MLVIGGSDLVAWLTPARFRMLVPWFLLLWIGETAWRLHGDASYDLLNYHLYAPFALLNGKWAVDLVPAQSQGFLPAFNDLPYYLLARHLGSIRLLNLLVSLPTVAALWIAFRISLRLLHATTLGGHLVALLAVVIGATGAASHPVLATSMSDMAPCALLFGGMLLLLRSQEAIVRSWQPPGLAAGLLIGVALGLKLTFSCEAAGLLAAILARPDLMPRLRLRTAFLFCLGAAIGFLALTGEWWWSLWRSTGNPIYPLYNNLFQSPLARPVSHVDTRFLPRDLAHWVLYPFYWAIDPTPRVTEPGQRMRDPRMALALLAALFSLLRLRKDGPARFAAVFFLISYILWERQFSIFRYLPALELLSGTMLALPALTLARLMAASLARPAYGPRAVLAGGLLLLAFLRWTIITPNWGRIPDAGGRPLMVHMPPLPEDSLVLLLDESPLAYLALFEPDRVRFFGANNNLTRPEQGGVLQSWIRGAIMSQPRDLYGIERPGFAPGMADQTLRAYGLRRTRCQEVTGNILGSTTLICALAKAAG